MSVVDYDDGPQPEPDPGRFDQCDGRNLNFERCQLEAWHGGRCSFPSERVDEWPDEMTPPDPL